jgi:hypothetical protein
LETNVFQDHDAFIFRVEECGEWEVEADMPLLMPDLYLSPVSVHHAFQP